MNREAILKTLREHEPELKAAGLAHLRLFGSVARGDHGPESDVDILAELDDAHRLSLLDIVGRQNMLADLLRTEVHLTLLGSLRESTRSRILPEAILAF